MPSARPCNCARCMSVPSHLRVWLLWLQQTSCSCNRAQRCFYFVLCSGGAAKGGAPKGGTSHKTAAGVDIRQLENDDDDGPMKLAKPSMELRLALSQARNAKGLSQKDFAAKLMIPASVIQDYESGKAIPNNGLIAKMERALGERKLRRTRKFCPRTTTQVCTCVLILLCVLIRYVSSY